MKMHFKKSGLALLAVLVNLSANAQQNYYLGSDGPGAPPDLGEDPSVTISQYLPYLMLVALLIVLFVGWKMVKKNRADSFKRSESQTEIETAAKSYEYH